jgi:starch synthase
MFHELPGARLIDRVEVTFRGITQAVDVFEVPGSDTRVRNVAFEHPLFSPHGPGKVYCTDEPARPFATDSDKFAFFCATAASWINDSAEAPDAVHLHDWHAAPYLILRQFSPGLERLRSIPTVFTIHNLAYQGVRPLSDDSSSLEEWFPDLRYTYSAVRDPHIAECYNPMAAAIRLADRISTVSPNYAREICEANMGEGLDAELAAARDDGRLIGILNGCEYSRPKGRRPGWKTLLALMTEQVDTWLDDYPASRMQAIAKKNLRLLPKRRPRHVLTSVGRLVQQKVSLLVEILPDGRFALEHVLEDLGKEGVVIILGSGESEYEDRVAAIAEQHPNLVFLCGYSESLAEPLYRSGDLFLMPSSFEPCGISQMLSMRRAQPCVVHDVGGLHDTVEDGRTGFVFDGDGAQEQASNFVAAVRRALTLRSDHNQRWQDICITAASERFSWDVAAKRTVQELYKNA